MEPKVETPLRPALETKLLEVLEQMDAIQDVRTVGNVVFDVPAHGRTHFGPRFGDDLEPLLTADPRFGDRGHLMVAADGGSISFYPRDVGSALLRKLYHSRSPEATLAWLTKVLGTKSAKGLSISILHGVQVEKAVELTPGVSLVPLKDVPNTFQLQRLSSIDLGSGSFMGWNPPSAALVSPREISPFVYDGRIQNEALLAKNNDAYLRSHALHTDLSRVLCLLGPCLPLIVEWWFVFDDPDLHLASSVDSRRSWPMIEITPGPRITPALINPADAVEIAAAYLRLDKDTKAVVDRALDRLRQAQARRQPGDTAVEVFTALEALLGDGETNELSHKMSTRAVRLLGGTPEHRAETFNALKKFYGVRSKIMHTGTIDSNRKFRLSPEMQLSLEELASKCTKICADVLDRIIRLGHIPKWAAFDINETH